MLLTIAGLLLVLGAAAYVAWPLLAAKEPGEAAPAPIGDAVEVAPEREKALALLAIREADFDHRTGKLSDEDHATLRAELEERALRAIAALDDASALHAVPGAAPASAAPGTAPLPRAGGEAAGFCSSCGQRFKRSARFCHACGKKLPAGTERGRRRA